MKLEVFPVPIKPFLVSGEDFVRYRMLSVAPQNRHFLTPYTATEIDSTGSAYLRWYAAGKETVFAGFWLKGDGEICNLFADPRCPKGTGKELVAQAVALGGNRVEYFDSPILTHIYEEAGFEETGRLPFDLDTIQMDWPGYDPDESGRPDYVIAQLKVPLKLVQFVFESGGGGQILVDVWEGPGDSRSATLARRTGRLASWGPPTEGKRP